MSSIVARTQNFPLNHNPSNKFLARRKSSISISVAEVSSNSLKSYSFDTDTDTEDSCARTDFGLESPTIVSHLIQTVRKESKMTTEPRNNSHNDNIPPPLGFDDFQTLSSTKQNIGKGKRIFFLTTR